MRSSRSIDYVIFLSIRGETELVLIDEGAISDENDPNALSPETCQGHGRWRLQQVEDGPDSRSSIPPIARTPPSRESILRGRELFLGKTKEKLECAGCHGVLAVGDGQSFVSQDVFNQVVFGGNPSERQERIDAARRQDEGPLGPEAGRLGQSAPPRQPESRRLQGRPAAARHLLANRQGDHRSPDAGALPDDQRRAVWDLVNFVLALPYEPSLLRGRHHALREPKRPGRSVANR